MNSSHAAPPLKLDQPLELDPADWQSRDVYLLTIGLVIPRPIGWISSVSSEGLHNLAPYSYFNAVAPDHVMFSSVGEKDSVKNIRETGEFVTNIVSMDLIEKMNFSSTDFPEDEDEFNWTGLTKEPSKKVKPFRVSEAKAHFECECVEIVKAGAGQVVIGKVVHMHVTPSVWNNGRVDPTLLDPVCRLAGNYYAPIGDIVKVERPFWRDVGGSKGAEKMPRKTPVGS